MTIVNKTIVLSKPIEVTWQFLNDFERVGRCLPGCQEVRVLSEVKSYWKIKISVGIVSRVLETEVIKASDGEKKEIWFHIRTKSGDFEGDLKIALFSVESATRLDLNFDVKAVGAFSWIINQMIGKQSDKMATQFVDCVNSNL